MKIVIDSSIRVPLRRISDDQLEKIKQLLTMPNPYYLRAEKFSQWGPPKGMSPVLENFQINAAKEELVVPRGALISVWGLLDGPDVEDRRVEVPYTFAKPSGTVHLHKAQREVVAKCLVHQQGVFLLPTGDGKTWTALEVARQSKQKLLVVVHREVIYSMAWKPDVQKYYAGRETLGIVRGKKRDYKSHGVTVAFIQTITAQMESLQEEGFFDAFGMVYYDEGHTAPAPSFEVPMNLFTARYKFTGTATEKRSDGMHPRMYACFGEKLFERQYGDAVRDGRVMPIRARVISTAFSYEPPVSFYDAETRRNVYPPRNPIDAEVFYEQVRDGAILQSSVDYNDLEDHLISDEHRNQIIIREILRDLKEYRHNYVLVTAKRKAHIEVLRGMLSKRGFQFPRITGDTSDVVRELIRRGIMSGKIRGIFATNSTVTAGASIKRLNRWHMASPFSDETNFIQLKGRICRMHSDKKDAVIVLYKDKSGPLVAQHNKRMKYILKGGNS